MVRPNKPGLWCAIPTDYIFMNFKSFLGLEHIAISHNFLYYQNVHTLGAH